jgi:hypothetical protein
MFKPVANGPLPPPSPTKRLVLRLSAELARLHDSQPSTLNLIAEARTYLARPEPQRPTDEELVNLFVENDWNYISPETFVEMANIVLDYAYLY